MRVTTTAVLLFLLFAMLTLMSGGEASAFFSDGFAPEDDYAEILNLSRTMCVFLVSADTMVMDIELRQTLRALKMLMMWMWKMSLLLKLKQCLTLRTMLMQKLQVRRECDLYCSDVWITNSSRSIV